MKVKIDANGRRRLVEVIAKGLETVQIAHNRLIDLNSLAGMFHLDDVLPKNQTEALKAYISDWPLFTFVFRLLDEDISSRPESANNSPQPLLSIPEYSNPLDVAERYVSLVETLPWTYHVFLRLQLQNKELLFDGGKGWLTISDEMALVVPDESFNQTYELPQVSAHGSLGRLFRLDRNKETWSSWDLDGAYLRTEVSGFIQDYATSASLDTAMNDTEAFLGLGLALKVFERSTKIPGTSEECKLEVFKRESDSFVRQDPHYFPLEISEVIGSIEVRKPASAFPGILGAGHKAGLNLLANAFRLRENHGQVLNASQWFFESYCDHNQLLSFVKAAIALETLLGGKKESERVGLGELLGNRCAYLIARSQKQREEILKDFGAIYATRSKIVHRGKNRLTAEELNYLEKLRWMCERILQEELRLLDANRNKPVLPPVSHS